MSSDNGNRPTESKPEVNYTLEINDIIQDEDLSTADPPTEHEGLKNGQES